MHDWNSVTELSTGHEDRQIFKSIFEIWISIQSLDSKHTHLLDRFKNIFDLFNTPTAVFEHTKCSDGRVRKFGFHWQLFSKRFFGSSVRRMVFWLIFWPDFNQSPPAIQTNHNNPPSLLEANLIESLARWLLYDTARSLHKLNTQCWLLKNLKKSDIKNW